MTFDDDHLQLEFGKTTRRVACKDVGVSWPPPERLEIYGIAFRRERMSAITDEQRQGMTHVMRGAQYVLLPENEQRSSNGQQH